jgi:hypothetical protein
MPCDARDGLWGPIWEALEAHSESDGEVQAIGVSREQWDRLKEDEFRSPFLKLRGNSGISVYCRDGLEEGAVLLSMNEEDDFGGWLPPYGYGPIR